MHFFQLIINNIINNRQKLFKIIYNKSLKKYKKIKIDK